jgi:hypothetical protein
MLEEITKTLGQLSNVRLHGGVVGKVSLAVIVGSCALGAIGVATHNPWVQGACVLGILGLATPLLWRLIGFARANPEAALLEGAEFLVHTQLTLASKNQPEFTDPDALVVLEEHTPDSSPVEVDGPDVEARVPTRRRD